ncbi:MAG: hypothetical protein JSS69_06845 [Acidobacteria bacterium]|nr:hypothetical protein [Acidobacteriota bacterium]MBS1865620.1 hypothetical protein [Acidobacteriota bacterium]
MLFPLFLTADSTAQTVPRVVHVFVALADNAHQGIVPVPAALGNGDDPDRNLYWGAAFGVRTFFHKSADWEQIGVTTHHGGPIIDTRIFRHKASGTYLIADAYRGSEIKEAVNDFFSAAAGFATPLKFDGSKDGPIHVNKKADLVVYVGHDGLMDFALEKTFSGGNEPKRQAIVLACASKQYFGAGLKPTGAEPLLWTTNLMAPEAYTLKAALDGWIAGENGEQVRQRAAVAYAKYQKISERAALKLFATGW